MAINPRLGMALQTFVYQLRLASKCKDKQVAAIILSSDMQQIYSIGINGGAKGMEEECLCYIGDKYSCIHAEANALIKLTDRVPNKIMLCSLAPCSQCAAMIINEPGGFSEVWYVDSYKDRSGVELLQKAGIKTGVLDAGGVVRYDI